MTTNTKTVAFVNLKGGVGKTTSAIGTAEALARLGHTVTVRDADRPARRPCGRTRPYRPAAHCPSGWRSSTGSPSPRPPRRNGC